jgi:hypothetical protein
MQAIRNFLTLVLLVKTMWRPAAALAFFVGVTLLRCDHSNRSTAKQVIDTYPHQMQQLRNWRLK